MVGMKGIYFSLDALLASIVLIASASFLISYDRTVSSQGDYNSDLLYTSSIQPVSSWNSSIKSNKTVLGYIYDKYYSGETEISGSICENYFDIEKKMALYFVGDSTEKICGTYKPSEKSALTSETVVSDKYVHNSLIGPKKAVLVISN